MELLNLLAQDAPKETFFGKNPGGGLWMMILIAMVISIAVIVFMMKAPSRVRRPIVVGVTFISGLFFVLYWLWPQPQERAPGDVPLNTVEGIGFFIEDAVGRIGDTAGMLTAFLLGLGAFSVLRIHIGKVAKQQKDWGFSIVLLTSMFAMIVIGYWSWYIEKFAMVKTDFRMRENWMFVNYAKDLLFDGFLQKMDGAMFSVIAFYIMSAAYRAFRIRSVEATILLASALIMMLSLLPIADIASSNLVSSITGGDNNHWANNLKLTEIAGLIRTGFQAPGIRAIDFGIGVGAMAMGLRLWLSLDKGGASI